MRVSVLGPERTTTEEKLGGSLVGGKSVGGDVNRGPALDPLSPLPIMMIDTSVSSGHLS